MNWFWYAIVSMVFLSIMFLFITKATKFGVRPELVYVFQSVFAIGLGLLYLFASKISISLPKGIWVFLILAGIFAVIGNFLMFKSISIAPNPGYAIAVISADALLVAIASIFIFKSEFTWIKAMGVILVTLGVVLLGWK